MGGLQVASGWLMQTLLRLFVLASGWLARSQWVANVNSFGFICYSQWVLSTDSIGIFALCYSQWVAYVDFVGIFCYSQCVVCTDPLTLVVVTLTFCPRVIALGWDRFGFSVRFSPPFILQIITQCQLLTWRYLAGNLIHHGDRKPRNIRLACSCSSASYTAIPGRFSYPKLRVMKNAQKACATTISAISSVHPPHMR